MTKRKERLKYIVQDDSGRPVYTGSHYRPDDAGGGSPLARIIGGAAVITVFVIASELNDAPVASGAAYVLLPFLGEAICAFIMWWELARLVSGKGKIRTSEHKSFCDKVLGSSRILAAFAAIGLICSVVFLVNNGTGEDMVKSIAYPVLKALTAASAALFGNRFKAQKWTEE